MLQQTQVNTVIPYYNKWIAKYPTLSSVAESEIDDLLKLWEGLGYYSRCRNFFNACQIIMNDYEGNIPSNIIEFKIIPYRLVLVYPFYTSSIVFYFLDSFCYQLIIGNCHAAFPSCDNFVTIK